MAGVCEVAVTSCGADCVSACAGWLVCGRGRGRGRGSSRRNALVRSSGTPCCDEGCTRCCRRHCCCCCCCSTKAANGLLSFPGLRRGGSGLFCCVAVPASPVKTDGMIRRDSCFGRAGFGADAVDSQSVAAGGSGGARSGFGWLLSVVCLDADEVEAVRDRYFCCCCRCCSYCLTSSSAEHRADWSPSARALESRFSFSGLLGGGGGLLPDAGWLASKSAALPVDDCGASCGCCWGLPILAGGVGLLALAELLEVCCCCCCCCCDD